jgi:hypothetical protein
MTTLQWMTTLTLSLPCGALKRAGRGILPFARARPSAYIHAMSRPAQISTATLAKAGLATAALAAASGVAFAAWIGNGAEIFLSMASNGLAWCF